MHWIISHNASHLCLKNILVLVLFQFNYLSSELPLKDLLGLSLDCKIHYIHRWVKIWHWSKSLLDVTLWKSKEGWIFSVSPLITYWGANCEQFRRLLCKGRTHGIFYQCYTSDTRAPQKQKVKICFKIWWEAITGRNLSMWSRSVLVSM